LHGLGATPTTQSGSENPYGSRHWAVFIDGKLLCVTIYKKGALAVRNALVHPMPGGTPETSGESLGSTVCSPPPGGRTRFPERGASVHGE
jgi:hypothetical protein